MYVMGCEGCSRVLVFWSEDRARFVILDCELSQLQFMVKVFCEVKKVCS